MALTDDLTNAVASIQTHLDGVTSVVSGFAKMVADLKAAIDSNNLTQITEAVQSATVALNDIDAKMAVLATTPVA